MQKRHPVMKPLIMLSLVVCMSTILFNPDLSAQPWQEHDLEPSAQVSPEDVTLEIIDLEAFWAQALAPQQGVDQYWAHGNSIHLEQPVSNITLNHFGFGGEVTIRAGSAGRGGWIHFSIPTPRRVAGAFAGLSRVMIVYNGNATIDRIDVWDGGLTRKLLMPVNLTGNGIAFLNFGRPPGFSFGIGISIHLINRCPTEFCNEQKMLFPVAGAEFTR